MKPVISIGLLITSLASWVGAALAAEHSNPALEARIQGIDDEKFRSEELRLADLDIRLRTVGNIAQVTLTARFDNPSTGDLEGDFSITLPDSSVVIGYALDVDGQMIDGVLVEPQKGETAYEARVRAGIDPGVATVSRANVFSTRVFPVLARQGRTIRLRFAAPIHRDRGLLLPLVTTEPVGHVFIELKSDALATAPDFTLPSGFEPEWKEAGPIFVAVAQLQDRPLSGELRLGPVHPTSSAILTIYPTGKRFFQLVDAAQPVARAATTGLHVRIYWDRSLSRRDDRIKDELALLERYLSEANPATIDVVVFNSSGAHLHAGLSPDAVKHLLRGIRYRGATSFAVLEDLETPGADVCLVFSDGVRTIDAQGEFRPGCEVFAIASAADADRGSLARLTRIEGGAVLRLGSQSDQEILARLRGGTPRIVDVRGEDGKALQFAALEAGPEGWAAVGEAPTEGGIIVRIAGLEGDIVERHYRPDLDRGSRFAGAAALWAADQISLVSSEDGRRDAMVALSRQYSVASPAMSYIVLESPWDYVEAGVAPPSSYPKQKLNEYRAVMANAEHEKAQAGAARLARVIEAWEEQKRWWDTRFDLTQAKKRAAYSPIGARGRAEPFRREGQPSPGVQSIEVTGERLSSVPDVQDQAHAITAFSIAGLALTAERTRPERRIYVDLESWSPDRPYLKALDATGPGKLDRVLEREQAKYADLPAFYLDVGEWLYGKNRVDEAIEMLLSALELPARNTETLSVVADRLLRYGQTDRAIWLYEQVRMLAPDRPQPLRTLALALAKRASQSRQPRVLEDLRRAVELLNEIIVTPWEDEFDGIELVSLMDVNSMIPQLRRLGESRIPVDPRLQALLDVDMRIVIEWNTAATDMDLWVDQPDGEQAIYGNPRTSIGGRLSNDMTQGYGPEEYLLRRATPGVYAVRVDVYASDRINPNGATSVTAHLYRDFGRPTQHEEAIEVEVSSSDQGETFIGNFTVTSR